jgi:hypothetical protein
MQEMVKRYFWVVIALAVAGSAVFAAKLVNHVAANKVLADAKHGPRIVRPAAQPGVAAASRSKDGQPIIDRNIFCSDCLPPVIEAAAPSAPVDPNVVVLTSLPLQLIATHVVEGRAAERDSGQLRLHPQHRHPDAGRVLDRPRDPGRRPDRRRPPQVRRLPPTPGPAARSASR